MRWGRQILEDSAASAGEFMEGIPGWGEVKKVYCTWIRVVNSHFLHALENRNG